MDEKPLLPPPAGPASPSYGRRRAGGHRASSWLLGAGIGVLLIWSSLSSGWVDDVLPACAKHHRHPHHGRHGHKGVKRTANATISWLPCADAPSLFCSSLIVPLNPLEPVRGEDAELFLKMFPAEEGKRQGSLLVNPGGPGGSGNFVVQRMGPALATIVEGRYDIVGFDPRGVNMTSPLMQAFDDSWQAELFGLEHRIDFSQLPTRRANLSDPAVFKEQLRGLRHHDALAELINDGIRQHVPEKQRRAVSTAFVARDMAALVDALGDGTQMAYWGFSYGTILGATFSAMFPDRVGRVVLDGVSHAGDYTGGLEKWGWSSMTDTNAVLAEFYRSCALAGSPRCALAPSADSGLSELDAAADIERKVNGLIETLWERPLGVAASRYGPGLLTATEVHLIIFQTLYSPQGWAVVADALSGAINGNGTLARELLPLPQEVNGKHPKRVGLSDNVFHRRVAGSSAQPLNAILCSDESSETQDLEELLRRSDELRERSFTAPVWTQLMLTCRSWTDRPFERYSGPWTVKDGLRKTRNKILWVGNTLDPVTPLASAKRMADGFGPESGTLLVQEARGHCSPSEPSLCAAKAISAYLVNGTLPAEGTVCRSEDRTFPGAGKSDPSSTSSQPHSAQDAALLEAVRALHEPVLLGGLF